jgi:Na+/H+-translocating membrane pyrophosphatase
VAAAAAWQLGNASSMPLGSSFAASCALMAMLATAPYLLAVATLGSIADGAQGVAAMAPGAVAEDAERCTARLDDAGFTGRSVAEIHLILTSGMAALLAATTLPALFHEELVIDLSQPTVVYCGALGMGFVIAYCASGLLSAVRGARSVALEVERQLRGFPREGGLVQVPREHTPSYRAAMDVTVRAALGRALLPVAAVLLGPALLGAGLLFAFRSQAPTLAAEGLVSFVILASITGLCVALAGDATRATLSAARRASRPRGITPAYGAAVSGDVLADLVGNATAPAAHLCAKAASVALLAVHAFLI